VNLPIGLVVLLSCLLLEPEGGRRGTRVEPGGEVLFALAVLSVTCLLMRLGEDPASVSSWQSWLLVPLGALLWAGLVRLEVPAPVPVLDVVLLRDRAFALVDVLSLL